MIDFPAHPDLQILDHEVVFKRHLRLDVYRFRHRLFSGAWSGERVWDIVRRGEAVALSRGWCVPIGFVGGAFSALFGTGGVLFALYNAGRAKSKETLRANNAAMIMLSSLVRVVIFTAAGLLAQDGLLAFAALLAPALLGGLWLGNRLHATVSAAAVVKAVYALLVIAGLTLLTRSL